MALPVAPPGFQGDLTDPNTGHRLFRLQQPWESVLASRGLRPVATAPPEPVVTTAVVPATLDEEIPSQALRWVWTAHGYYPMS